MNVNRTSFLCIHFFDFIDLNWCQVELFKVFLVVNVVHRNANIDGRLDCAGNLGGGFRRRGYF